MKIKKKEFASLGDGKLVKTVCIELISEDKEDERIIKEKGNRIYL